MVNIKDVMCILSSKIKKSIEDNKRINEIQEIRIRINNPVIFQVGEDEVMTKCIPSVKDIQEIVQRMSNYSVYAYDEDIKQGYITIKGGHRVGICGKCVVERDRVKTIRCPSSLNIRICREVLGCSNKVMKYIIEDNEVKNTILISPPRCGKTTLLRDISKNISDGIKSINYRGRKVCIIDERSELCGCMDGVPQLSVGIRTDVLDNCPKTEGIMMAIRSMSPDVIVCDEIGTSKDIESITKAMNSGVKLITSVHGYNLEDIEYRDSFKQAIQNKTFERAIILSNKKGAGTIDYIYNLYERNIIFKG